MKNEPLKGKAQECLVEFDGELIRNREFRFQDVKSAVQGLLKEIEEWKEWNIGPENEIKKITVKKLLRKWFADVFE